jgi:hypothetical protein
MNSGGQDFGRASEHLPSGVARIEATPDLRECIVERLSKHFPQFERSTWRVFVAGLLVRLLLMPFAAHSDLMHMYWGAHLIPYHQEFTLGFEGLLRYAHAGYLWLTTSLFPSADSLWIHHIDDFFLNPFASPLVVSSQGWFDFVSHPQIYRTLFLLKLPYLFFDLACAFLLYRLGSDRAKSRLMFTFWWLNPILIFAVYVFGRHEVIALFFIILSIYLIERGRWRGGLLALGVAVAVRYYAIFLLPFYVLSLGPARRKRVQGLIIGLAPWLVMNLINWSLAGSLEAKGLINLPHDNYLLSMKFQVAAWDNLYIFPLLYFLLVLHRLCNREFGLRSLVRYNLIALLLLYATAYTGQSPQYWTWYLPFLAISVTENRRLLSLHVVQILCLVVYSFIGGRSTAGYLLAPIAPDFFWSLPSPVDVIGRFAPPEVVIGLARTALSAVTLWMAYLVFRRMRISIAADAHTEGEA